MLRYLMCSAVMSILTLNSAFASELGESESAVREGRVPLTRYTGSLIEIGAIGGETQGYAISTGAEGSNSYYELYMPNHLFRRAQRLESDRIAVDAHWIWRRGVERGWYRVLHVHRLFVLR